MKDRPGCTGKIRYETRTEAKAARKKSSHYPGQPEKKLHVYRCQFCGGFHLTTWSANREKIENQNGHAVATRRPTHQGEQHAPH